MRKVIVFLSLLVIIVIASAFTEEKNNLNESKNFQAEISSVPTQQEALLTLDINIPFIGNSFNGFREAVAFKESQGRYHVVNTLGYLGKYQFGMETLKTIGINNSAAFLNSPKMQEEAFVALLSKNKWELQDEILKYDGRVLNGIKITESGILAAAHLGGVGSVKRYLRSNGKRY